MKRSGLGAFVKIMGVFLIVVLVLSAKAEIVSYWDCDDGSGVYLVDKVGSNDARLYNRSTLYDGSWDEDPNIPGTTGPHFGLDHADPNNPDVNCLEFNLDYDIKVYYDSAKIFNPVGLDFGTNDFTLAGWFRIEQLDTIYNESAVLFNDCTHNVSGINVNILRANHTSYGRLSFNIKGSNGATVPEDNIYINSTPRLHDGEWHWFAGVVENRTLRLYVDGVLESTVAAYGASTSASPAATTAFGIPGTMGAIDDFVFFNHRLKGVVDGNGVLIGGNLFELWKNGPYGVESCTIDDTDFNNDCVTDFVDFAYFATKWLNCTDPVDGCN